MHIEMKATKEKIFVCFDQLDLSFLQLYRGKIVFKKDLLCRSLHCTVGPKNESSMSKISLRPNKKVYFFYN